MTHRRALGAFAWARAALLVLLVAGCAAALAQDPLPLPPLKARVTDLTGTLTPEEQSRLESQIARFEADRGSQIAILMLPTTAPEAIEQFSIRLAEAWKIGRQGKDDGVIVVVAKDDRRLRLEVGYGLEGAIPDAVAKRVVSDVITPRFRAGDWYGGLSAGVTQIQKLIEGEQLPPPAEQAKREGGSFEQVLVIAFVAAVVVGGILRAIFGRLLGSGLAAGGAGTAAMFITGSLLTAIIAGVIVFFFVIVTGVGGGFARGHRGPYIGGGWGGGGFGGGGGGWGGGGGGGFGGGGASGNW